ncbi:MAG: hypothetical protein PWQ17_391 [Anaerophaga sp.]|nr:hypothetical protein [Anaerophaga sp.]
MAAALRTLTFIAFSDVCSIRGLEMKFSGVVLVLFLSGLFAKSQIPELRFVDLPGEDKLSSQFTTCITQDKTGYIWIGTVDGLNRYDGYQIKVYRNHLDKYPNLANNNIRSLFCDSRNRLWIGTIWGLSLYRSDYDSFQLMSSSANTAGLTSSFVYQIDEDSLGNIFVAAGNGLFLYDESTQYFEQIIDVEGGPIATFCFDEAGGLWLGQEKDGGLKYISPEDGYQKKPLPSWPGETDLVDLSDMTITDIIAQDSLLWVSTLGNGVFKLNFHSNEIKGYLTGHYESFVVDLYKDNKGNIWSCDYIGLKFYNRSSDSFVGYYSDSANEYSIKRNPIRIFQDHQDNYWVIYSEKGFDLSSVERGFQLFTDDTDSYWPLSDINVMSICEDDEGNLWCGGYNGGITVFDWDEGATKTFHFSEDDTCSLADGSIFDIHPDNRNDIWVGSYFGGLQKYDSQKNCFISFVHHPDDIQSIGGNDVRAVEEDTEGNFWLAIHGVGVDYFKKKEGIFEHFTPGNSDLSGEWTTDVLLDHQQTLWVGTSNGLNKLKRGDDKFKSYLFYNQDKIPRTLYSNEIICLHETPDNKLWIGTTSGLHRYHPGSDDFSYHSRDFSNQYICSIEHDANGNLWVSTHGGLTRYNPETGEVFNFDVADNLQSNDFNPRSSHYDGEKYLFFGGPSGLNSFAPDEINYNLTPPMVILTNLSIFNEPVTKYGEDQPLKKHISSADKIRLSYSDKLFSIEYIAINYIAPEKTRYAYKLMGFEEKWHYVGNKREATYTNLNPGTYTFRVKAANNDGIWNQEGASIQIEIFPPWYRTTWFVILAVITVFTLLYYGFWLRTRVLRRQKAALTKLIKERTKKIDEKNQMLKKRALELDQSNQKLEKQKRTIEIQANELKKQTDKLRESNENLQKLNTTKDRLFSIIAHDVRAPFNTIIGFSSLLQEMAAEGETDVIIEYAGYIHESANQALTLLENLLYWAMSQTNEIIINPGIVRLKEIIDDNIKLLNESAIKKGIKINTSEVDETLEMVADKDMIKTVIRNLVSNAIKFTPPNGKIFLSAYTKNEYCIFKVSDTGAGISSEEVEQLKSSSFLTPKPGTNGEKGSGLGLTISREFVEQHGGRLIVESTIGKGSTFGFEIPLKQKK